MKLIIAPFKDPADIGIDSPEQFPVIKADLGTYLEGWVEGPANFEIRETAYPVGIDWPTVTIEIAKYGGALLAIPAAHRLIREAIEEWRLIWRNLKRLIAWVEEKYPIISYSIEVAFLATLARLEQILPVEQLELVAHHEIPGATQSTKPSFETTPYLQYVFVFRLPGESLHVVVINSRLEVGSIASLPLRNEVEGSDPEAGTRNGAQ